MTTKNDALEYKRSATFERSLRLVPGYNVIMAGRIAGDIQEAGLRDAIKKIQTRHPMLRVHLEYDGNHEAWFTTRGTTDLTPKVLDRASEHTWLEACHEENKIAFSSDKEPLLRIILVKGTEKSDLILFGQHAICDGAALVFLMRDLLSFLADPSAAVEVLSDLPTLEEAADLEEIKLHPLIRLVISKLKEAWTGNEIHFGPEDFAPLQTVFDNNNSQVLIQELGPETTKFLLDVSRKHGVTINTLLYSAFITAQLEIEGDEKAYLKNILMPVNLRPHLGVGEVVGFYAGGEGFPHRVALKKNFWKRTRSLHKRLKKHATRDAMLSNAKRVYALPPSWLDARSMLPFGKKLPAESQKFADLLKLAKTSALLKKIVEKSIQGEFQIGMAMTNLGRMDIPEKYGNLELESLFFVPPTSLLTEKAIGVLTIGGTLRIALSYLESHLSKNDAKALLSRAMEILTKSQT